jgi:hypothetical protein
LRLGSRAETTAQRLRRPSLDRAATVNTSQRHDDPVRIA